MTRLLLLLVACGAPDAALTQDCLSNACAGAFDCAMGTRCNQALSPPRCEKIYCGAEGSACDDDLLCSSGTLCLSGTCSSGPTVGQPCDSVAIACSGALACVRTAGSCDFTCQPNPASPVAVGKECFANSECVSQQCNHTGGGCLGTCASTPPPYPPGPYGFAKGSVIADLAFEGKRAPAGAYSSIPMTPIPLSDYYRRSDVKYLVLLGEVAWGQPCKTQQSQISSWAANHLNVHFLEVLTEGDQQSAATESDLNAWGAAYGLHIDLAIDPQQGLFEFSSETASFPLVMVIATETMTIVHSSLGEVDLTATLDALP